LDFKVSAGGNFAERLLMSGEMCCVHVRERGRRLLSRCEVSASCMNELPARFLGGMQQRLQIAWALATDLLLLFLDEVTTGPGVAVQARILDLIMELQHQLGVSMIAVTHDLGLIRMLASRTLVMKMGCVVESDLTDQILGRPGTAPRAAACHQQSPHPQPRQLSGASINSGVGRADCVDPLRSARPGVKLSAAPGSR
jgi:putative phosphonate transport system ATP-binding protein